ncbi:hypothetical protein DDZ14_15105 [Maritimibacter sp. 55A14]|uniref:hypothetical protein n=1 Tax=Maritimibacter sp. 55A14 TaxID=2174844 RepID=UPI000D604638|nr:hypothetical protein [Maritimibacter sp. 55A14]PWE30608.1 hypothetical protein DDZ14_15105 [Maritimibacter sp. 55A14]
MTNAIDAAGNVVPHASDNLTEDNQMGFSYRDITAEERAKGHFSTATTYIDDAEANNNPSVVTRDGSRQHVPNGDYQPSDLLMIDGMEVTYEMATSLGLVKGDTFSTPEDVFRAGAENQDDHGEPEDTRPEAARLLSDQLQLALGADAAPAALETFGMDIVENGEIGEAGFQFAADKLGMPEKAVREIYSDMQETGSQIMSDFMETGDGFGANRMAFLVEKAESGNQKEQAIIRNLWFMAATGKLSRTDAAEAFDYLYKPYEA